MTTTRSTCSSTGIPRATCRCSRAIWKHSPIRRWKKSAAESSAYLHGVGGTDTHVHLARSIEPFVTISDLVQESKGAASFEVNQRMNRKALEWQRGYGVVSFGKRNLEWVLDYVRRQLSIMPPAEFKPGWRLAKWTLRLFQARLKPALKNRNGDNGCRP